MNKLLISMLLATFAFATAACNTTRGVGQDIEAAGAAIEDAAEDTKDRMTDDEG